MPRIAERCEGKVGVAPEQSVGVEFKLIGRADVIRGTPQKRAAACYLFASRKLPIARCSRPEMSNTRSASSGEQTTGSPWRLKEVFRMMASPVNSSKWLIKR